MRSDHYKEIHLASTSHPVAVPVAVYEQVKAIVESNRICEYCFQGYTADRPQVALNVCLACFQKHRTANPTNLTFVGEVVSEYAQQYGYQIFKFMDAQGYISVRTSHERLNDSMQRDIRQTLLHYGYKLPEQYTLKTGGTVELETYAVWLSMYGDFKTSPVVLATYHESYGHHISTVFVLYRDREPIEFSKMKNPTRQWYRDEKAALEATYTPREGYVVGTGEGGYDRTAYHLEDHHLYPGIVRRAIATYEAQQKGVPNANL